MATDLDTIREKADKLQIKMPCDTCGHCADNKCLVDSFKCAADILNREEPPRRWLNREEGD